MTWKYTVLCNIQVQYASVQCSLLPKFVQDTSRNTVSSWRWHPWLALKSDRHTDYSVNHYTWQKHTETDWCTDILAYMACLTAASKSPHVLLVLSVPIRPLIVESSSQDTASNNCIICIRVRYCVEKIQAFWSFHFWACFIQSRSHALSF